MLVEICPLSLNYYDLYNFNFISSIRGIFDLHSEITELNIISRQISLISTSTRLKLYRISLKNFQVLFDIPVILSKIVKIENCIAIFPIAGIIPETAVMIRTFFPYMLPIASATDNFPRNSFMRGA